MFVFSATLHDPLCRGSAVTAGSRALSTGASSVKVIQIKVKPGARTSLLEEQSTGVWIAKLKSPPIDGKANQELVALVARHFGCSKSAVSIKSGASGRTKLVRIEIT